MLCVSLSRTAQRVTESPPAGRPEYQSAEEKASSRPSRSPLKSPNKGRNMQCKVSLLDGTEYTCVVEKRARGQLLFDKVCDHLNLLEKDYFGLTFRDVENQKNWLDPAKELKKQIRSGAWSFAFNVKFYPPDPAQLSEDITRYYLCLQLRDDVVSGRLPCSFATHTVLGSYTVQSELGDYDPEELAADYASEFRFAPNQTKELEEKVMDLHKNYKGMTPAEAEMHFLENAKKLSMYGVDLHHAKLIGSFFECLAPAKREDSEGVEIMLGVCASGLLIYRDRLRINRFAWPKVLKISYKRNNFYIKIRPGEFEQFESTIGFKLPNHRAAKRLWKVCVEHHTFFRLVSPEAPPKKFLTLGSKFRYSGRTQAQTRWASSKIMRPAPYFERSASKRYTMSRSLDGEVGTVQYSTAKAIATSDLITTVTPEKKAEEERAEEEEEKTNATEASEPAPTTPVKYDTKYSFIRRVKGDNVFVKHSNLMLEESATPEELVKRQTNISELKRSFLETGSDTSGLTEWEKRLSASPVRSPRLDEAPMIEPLTPEDTKEDSEATDMDILKHNASVPDGKPVQPKPASEMSPQLAVLLASARGQTGSMGWVTSPSHSQTISKTTETVTAKAHPSVEAEQPNTTSIRKSPVLETETVNFRSTEGKEEFAIKDVPVVHTETKTITYESSMGDASCDSDPGLLMSAQTITSETTSTTTTTHITKTVKGGISETRIEKRIVITGDADIDHDQALAQAIKEAKEQHPDMSVTKVVVHKETEITPVEGEE
ncbi:band 4.1-like protein 3 isoform X11 [Brienomyrus brachyistius]|uniref:band 4.1-like protein 3 isoform X11 n=1 Tax=Brienomyrus brachyistius TaxID=42636 RepID=UPI0020B3873C|nr:band 4.1-like protein 3 isoform X11 [Brienomyrus brachyistius]